MSKIDELVALMGSREAAEDLLKSADWLTNSLVEKGVAYKAADLDKLLAGLSEADLQRLYARIGKLLKGPQSRVSDTEGKKIIKLLGPKPTKQPALSRNFQEGLQDIEAARAGVAQKNLGAKTALDLSFDEGMLAIARERGLSVRVTKGRKGRFSKFPPFEMTTENIQGIAEIMAWRQKNQEHPGGKNPIDLTASEGIEAIEAYRDRQKRGGMR